MKRLSLLIVAASLLASCGTINVSSTPNSARGEGPHVNKSSVVESTSEETPTTSETKPSSSSEEKTSESKTSETKTSSEQKRSSSQTRTSSSEQKTSPDTPSTGVKTITANFPTDKIAIDLSSNSGVFDTVKAAFGEHLVNMTTDCVYADEGGVKLSSGKVGATWNLTFDSNVKSVSVWAKPYSSIRYGDTNLYIDGMYATVNGQSLLDTEATTAAQGTLVEYQHHTINLDTPAKKLEILGEGGKRPLISSMILILE